MKNVSDKGRGENRNTHFMFNKFFFFNRVDYEIMWKNNAAPEKPHLTILRMRISFCIPTTIHTYPEYVIFIAFPLQQWLHERASMLRYTYIACIFFF